MELPQGKYRDRVYPTSDSRAWFLYSHSTLPPIGDERDCREDKWEREVSGRQKANKEVYIAPPAGDVSPSQAALAGGVALQLGLGSSLSSCIFSPFQSNHFGVTQLINPLIHPLHQSHVAQSHL